MHITFFSKLVWYYVSNPQCLDTSAVRTTTSVLLPVDTLQQSVAVTTVTVTTVTAAIPAVITVAVLVVVLVVVVVIIIALVCILKKYKGAALKGL